MTATPHRIGLFAAGLAALKLLPSAPRSLRAAAHLAAVWPDSQQSIGLLLEVQARKYPEKDCLLFEGQRWNYRDFNAWANRIASVLTAQGVQRGDTVGIMFDNHPELLACVAATVKLGAVAGMLNPKQRGEVLRHSVGVIKPKLMVVGAQCLTALHTAFPKKPRGAAWLWVGHGPAPKGMVSLPLACEQASPDNPEVTGSILAREACFLIFTSGTTGMPKASVMTHQRWLRSGYGMGQLAMRLGPDDIFYCALPFHHNNALTLSWGAVLRSGATLAMARKFSASRFWDDIRASRATAFVYIGELCRYLLNQPVSQRDREHRIRVMVGNGLRPEIWDEFAQRFGVKHICEFYGSSEGNLGFVNALGLPRTAGCCPLPYAIVAFDTENECPRRDASGFMQRVHGDEVGLLISEVTRANPFDGYTDAKATEAKLLRNVFKPGDVWINSGDLVRDQGLRHIAFVDRVGDTFRWKGENVASTEIEGVISGLKGIEQASVYGVQIALTDGRAGMAAIVLKHGMHFDGASLARQLLLALPAYAVPLFVRIIPAHKTTATFKIRKVELKQQGFDPKVVDDPLYVLLDPGTGYQSLTLPVHARIQRGELRF